jgi:hypothetical protein
LAAAGRSAVRERKVTAEITQARAHRRRRELKRAGWEIERVVVTDDVL